MYVFMNKNVALGRSNFNELLLISSSCTQVMYYLQQKLLSQQLFPHPQQHKSISMIIQQSHPQPHLLPHPPPHPPQQHNSMSIQRIQSQHPPPPPPPHPPPKKPFIFIPPVLLRFSSKSQVFIILHNTQTRLKVLHLFSAAFDRRRQVLHRYNRALPRPQYLTEPLA